MRHSSHPRYVTLPERLRRGLRFLLGGAAVRGHEAADRATRDVRLRSLNHPGHTGEHKVAGRASAPVNVYCARLTESLVVDRGVSMASLLDLSIHGYSATAESNTSHLSMSFREIHTFATDISHGPNY